MKVKIYLKKLLLLKAKFAPKRDGKGLLVQIKEKEVYKILTKKELTDETDSPFEKVEPHKKF